MRKLLSTAFALGMVNIVAIASPDAFTSVGIVVDESNEPVTGATVSTAGGKALGVTDIDGKFKVQVPDGTDNLTVTFIGYKPLTLSATQNVGTVAMEIESQMLADVVVTQSLARTRETPDALSQINAAEIDFKLGNQEFPEVLKTTPGVWTTKEGGGFGDAKTNMRGFKSENVAVVINGIPINDMEWGGVYWSNWAG
ncbi:MAG: TonB-dependent receptor, partial [Muribaculaceae bacterium]|nr:TonB-dependent receptor [Muribaculaceae bacterium]